MVILSIDPGPVESGYVLLDSSSRRPLRVGKVPNAEVLDLVCDPTVEFDVLAIEMVASFGMPVGAEVFETCVWIGRYDQAAWDWRGIRARRHPRIEVRLHHCHHSQARDSNILRALVDRFAFAQPNMGKGTKSAPGWFYGFKKDIWQAAALGVMVADQIEAEHISGANAR